MSNLKQIGLGLLQYSQDYDETMVAQQYPRNRDGANLNKPAGADNYYWMDASYPYIKSEQVFACPSDSAATRNYKFVGLYPNNSGTNSNYGTYSANTTYYVTGDNFNPPFSDLDQSPNRGYILKMSQIAKPSETVWLADGKPGSLTFFWEVDEVPNIINDNGISILPALYSGFAVSVTKEWGHISARHLETTNVLYCDGHVKATRLNALAATKTDSSGKKYLPPFTVEDD